MIVVGSMPRFSMGSGATPKGAVRSSATPTLVSLQGIVAPSLPSVQPVSTKGKVVFLFGTATKYPCFKFVVVAEGEPECKVLVKCNQPAPVSLSVDDMVLIGKAEARLTWKRNGQILESHVASRLADVELAVNLPGPKRKRSVESFFEVNFSLELCSSQAFRGIPVSLFIGAPPKKQFVYWMTCSVAPMRIQTSIEAKCRQSRIQALEKLSRMVGGFCWMRQLLRLTLQILPDENCEGFPKASFDVLPSLAAVGMPSGGDEAYCCARLSISEVGALVEGEKPRRMIRCSDMEGEDPASSLVELPY